MQSAVSASPLKSAPAAVPSSGDSKLPAKAPPAQNVPATSSGLSAPHNNAPGSFIPPKLVRRVEPVYAGSKLRGTVRLSLFVTPAGNVRTIKVIRRLDATLDRYAIQAVAQWRYQPALINGRPATVQITEDVAFPPK